MVAKKEAALLKKVHIGFHVVFSDATRIETIYFLARDNQSEK